MAAMLLLSGVCRSEDAPAAAPDQPDNAVQSAAGSAVREADEYLRTGRYGIGNNPVQVFAEVTPQRDRIELALQKSVELEFIDTELLQAVGFLAERYQIPIRPDVSALSEVGIGLETGVNLVISGVTLRDALELVLAPLQLDYVIQQDVLHVTTREVAAGIVETRLYDLQDFPDAYSSEVMANLVRGVVQPESWRIDSGAPGLAETLAGVTPPAAAADRGPATTAAPASSPPRPGAMQSLPGALVVTHNQRTHREIAALLNQVARFAAAQQPHRTGDSGEAPPEVGWNPERAAQQIVRLSGVTIQLEHQVAALRSELLEQKDAAKVDRDRLNAEIDRWQEVYARTLSELEAARAEARRLQPKDQ